MFKIFSHLRGFMYYCFNGSGIDVKCYFGPNMVGDGYGMMNGNGTGYGYLYGDYCGGGCGGGRSTYLILGLNIMVMETQATKFSPQIKASKQWNTDCQMVRSSRV
jgi:hypothetical protein